MHPYIGIFTFASWRLCGKYFSVSTMLQIPQQFRRRHPDPGNDPAGIEIAQGFEDEPAAGESGVGNFQAGEDELFFPEEQDVEVDDARRAVPLAAAPHLLFDGEGEGVEHLHLEPAFEVRDGVQVGRLVGAPLGGIVVEGGDAPDIGDRDAAQQVEGVLQIRGALPEIAPQREKDVGHGAGAGTGADAGGAAG